MPYLSVPGDIGQSVDDAVDGPARDAEVHALTSKELLVRLDGRNRRVANENVSNAWGKTRAQLSQAR